NDTYGLGDRESRWPVRSDPLRLRGGERIPNRPVARLPLPNVDAARVGAAPVGGRVARVRVDHVDVESDDVGLDEVGSVDGVGEERRLAHEVLPLRGEDSQAPEIVEEVDGADRTDRVAGVVDLRGERG